MADEVVETQETQGSTTTEQKTESTDQQKTTGTSTQVTAPDRKAEDDRNRGILADLQKERKARQQFEQQARDFQTKYETEQRRVQALAGVNPRSAEDTESEAVRQRFGQLFPGLAKLTDQQIEKLLSVAASADSLEEATQHHWQTHGRQMLDSVVAAASKQLGGTLSARQQARLKQAYVQEAEANPEFLARHEQGDPTLVEEFIKDWNEDWFEPARRKVTQTEVERQRRVPSGRDRSVASQGGKKLDYNNPKAVEDALVASFKEHGGAFGE